MFELAPEPRLMAEVHGNRSYEGGQSHGWVLGRVGRLHTLTFRPLAETHPFLFEAAG